MKLCPNGQQKMKAPERHLWGFLRANCHRLYRLATCKHNRRLCLLWRRERMKLCFPNEHPLSVVGLGGDNDYQYITLTIPSQWSWYQFAHILQQPITMYIWLFMCICYNANRQERCECSCGTQKAPEVTTPGLFYSVLGGRLNPKADYQLFNSIQPSANVVGDYTCHNREKKRCE